MHRPDQARDERGSMAFSATTSGNTTAKARSAKGRLTQRVAESHGQSNACDAASTVTPVLQREDAAVRFGDLATEHEPDAGSRRLRGVERDEQVGGRRETGAFVRDLDVHMTILTFSREREAT